MRTRSKLMMIGLVATMFMALAIGTASARNLSISNQNIRMTFNNIELIGGGISTTSCHVTLEGSFHSRTLSKNPETLVGFLTRVTTGNCNNPITILSATLPWHIRYTGFSGTLPNITSIIAKAIDTGFQVEPGLGLRCLARVSVAFRAIREAGGVLSGIEVPSQEVGISGTFCPETVEFRSGGNGSIMLLGATTRLTVTLI